MGIAIVVLLYIPEVLKDSIHSLLVVIVDILVVCCLKLQLARMMDLFYVLWHILICGVDK